MKRKDTQPRVTSAGTAQYNTSSNTESGNKGYISFGFVRRILALRARIDAEETRRLDLVDYKIRCLGGNL